MLRLNHWLRSCLRSFLPRCLLKLLKPQPHPPWSNRQNVNMTNPKGNLTSLNPTLQWYIEQSQKPTQPDVIAPPACSGEDS